MSHSTSRASIQALVRGQPAAQPVFLPLIFTLAAKVEGIALPSFVSNPTKIANSLSAIHQRIQGDGVAGYFDLALVAEALGCQLDWQTVPPSITRPQQQLLQANLDLSPKEIASKGRIPVALEVVRRLTMTMPKSSVLLVGLPGPLRLATQLFGSDFVEHFSTQDADAQEHFELLTDLLLHLAQAFCVAGTHILFMDEVALPVGAQDEWAAAMEPCWNTVRFHSTLPVLRVRYDESGTPSRTHIDGPLLCLSLPADAAVSVPDVPFAFALPPSPTEQEIRESSRWTTSPRCVFITTDGELPYQSDIQELTQRVSLLRSAQAFPGDAAGR